MTDQSLRLPGNLIPVSCNRDCGGGCPLAAEIVEGRPVRIIDNPLRPDPDIRGCSRGFRALDQALSPDRLTTPLKRTGPRGSGAFEKISWDQALDEVAGKLSRLKEEYGTEALMVLSGSGSCRGAVHTTSGLTKRFFALYGRHTTTTGYYSNTAAMFTAQSVYGMTRAGQDALTLRGTQAVILWGANIRDLRFGAKLEPVLKRLKKEGVPFFVIDPRLSRTAALFADARPETRESADSRWLAIRPGTDSALMAAILFIWIKEAKIDRSFVTNYTSGFDDLESWVTGGLDGIPKSPGWAAEICGLPEAQIRNIAKVYGEASPAALIPGLSIQRAVGGEEAYRMGMALQAARGSVGVPGGSSGGVLWDTMPAPRVDSIAGLDLPPGIEAPLTVPVNNWQDAVLDRPLRGIYGVGHNYLLQASDQEKTRRVHEEVDFSVCHDLFLTGTALWSDYVLPATHFLERNDILSAAENYLYYTHKVLDPPGEARNDYDIYRDLAERLGFGDEFGRGRTSDQWIDTCLAASEVPDPGAFRESGFYDPQDHDRILLADFIRAPKANPLNTPDGRINFHCSENEAFGFHPWPHYREASLGEREASVAGRPDQPPLQLITPHARHRTNSQHSNLTWFKEQEFPLLYMHPEDAELRGIDEGATVRLYNGRGELTLPVTLTPGVRPGVVWTLAGHWEIDKSANRLSSTRSTLPSHGSRTHSIEVFAAPAD